MAEPEKWSASVVLMTKREAWDATPKEDQDFIKAAARKVLEAKARGAGVTVQGNARVTHRQDGVVLYTLKGLGAPA